MLFDLTALSFGCETLFNRVTVSGFEGRTSLLCALAGCSDGKVSTEGFLGAEKLYN